MMKKIVFFVLAHSIMCFAYAQVQNQGNFIGIWDYNLKFYGVKQISGWEIYSKDSMSKKYIDGANKWYIALSDDSISLIPIITAMGDIDIKNPLQAWDENIHSHLHYLAEKLNSAPYDFLPNGHWIKYSTQKNVQGIEVEKFINNHKLIKYYKSYDHATNMPDLYFEVENGLLNGIYYRFSVIPPFNNFKAIDTMIDSSDTIDMNPPNYGLSTIQRYVNGNVVEILY